MRLADRVAVITGAGTGIGEATARRFVQEGARVAVADLDVAGGERVAKELQAQGAQALFVRTDVTVKAEVETLIQRAVAEFGRLDILVNNAGINRDAFAAKLREEDWDAVLAVNLKGTFLCAQAALMVMSAQSSGRIINTSSIGALGNLGQANYAASKAGVIGLTKTLALEAARYNVTVNAVAPGATETRMTAGIPEKVREVIVGKIPLRRMARPEEIAALHAFLASDEAAYITGQVIFVDGGISVGF
ncbi:MAG: 3-oxoacyl-ACP reductase FabG [Deltaproteobacteria bacterium]|nr:3-oxoacyl-ACP reductase FabG [Deltaproteobacteria bacterium]